MNVKLSFARFFRHCPHGHSRRTLLLAFTLTILGMPFTPAFSPPLVNHLLSEDTLTINIECTQTSGTITPYAEINCGPLPIHYVKDGADLTEQYRNLGISCVRTHDFYGPTDVSEIFPRWNADPSLASSYNFTRSDQCITGIINAGCEVFYRLGESASDDPALREPPENFSKWAEICKHIIMHYNDGWNNGYHYNISYWEIWNEPDLSGFWNSTADEYYRLYHITATTLKEYNESLKIGGPCTSSIDNENFTEGFLRYVKTHNLPLDFFSWHLYADTPHDFFTASQKVRTMLDSYGFTECENINTEWNINILTPQRDKDNARNAAFTACTLTVFQDAAIDHAFRYRGTQDNNWLERLLGFDLGLFAYDGTYKTPALSYLAMHYMARDSPIRLATPPMDASKGITYLAGIAEDKANITVLITNFESEDTTCTLTITNLPWNGSYRAVHYLIDDRHHLEITGNETSLSNYTATFMLKRNTVQFIRLTNATSIPDEGPPVAPIPFLLRLRILDPFTRMLGILLLMLIFG